MEEGLQTLGQILAAVTVIALAVIAYLAYRLHLPRKHQQFVEERDDYLYRPRLNLERKMIVPRMAIDGIGMPRTKGLLWRVGLQNPGPVAIFATQHWVQFKSPETSKKAILSPHQYKVYEIWDDTLTHVRLPLTVTAEKEVVLQIFVDDPSAEDVIRPIMGQQRTLAMMVRIGYQISHRKQYGLVADEVSQVFTLPETPEFGSTHTDFAYE